ncbi:MULTISPECIES: hypothetical protein [Hyphomonas]|uniref:hypothetical protein n=1 Tax=Hyphomonas TaxID=85 RepID=UPI002357864F|nr:MULTISPECIES: hypothetical protein [Hyphomonas]
MTQPAPRKLKGLRHDIDRHGNERWYTIDTRGRKIRMQERPHSQEWVREWARIRYGSADRIPRTASHRPDGGELDRLALEKLAARILKRAAARAEKRSMAFEITEDSGLKLLRAQRYCCAASGIRFLSQGYLSGNSARAPFRPSLDRIDSALGYVPGNVRWICVALNIAFADWGEQPFRQLAEAYIKNKTSHPDRPLGQG